MTLTDLRNSNPPRYSTDKTDDNHTVWGKNYLDIYEPFFSRLRMDPISILEFGIASGGSLRLWRDYFQRAQIYGVDLNAAMRCLETEEKGVNVIIANQSDGGAISTAVATIKDLSIIIDDASHHISDIIASFDASWPQLVPGGIYVIEDLKMSYHFQERPLFMQWIEGILYNLDDKGGTVSCFHCFPMLMILEKGSK